MFKNKRNSTFYLFIFPFSLENGDPKSKRQTSINCGPAAGVAHSKEFDPLSAQRPNEENTQNKVMSSFGLSSDGRLPFAILICFVACQKSKIIQNFQVHFFSSYPSSKIPNPPSQ